MNGRCESDTEREPKDGESYDKCGNIRPVPPGVPNTPDEVVERPVSSDDTERVTLCKEGCLPLWRGVHEECPQCGSRSVMTRVVRSVESESGSEVSR